MGNSAICTRILCVPRPTLVLFLGLDGVGKTSSLYRLKLHKDITGGVISTCGFNVETVSVEDDSTRVYLTIWDVGGGARIYPLWKHYFSFAEGVVFIVDASDSSRRDEEKRLFSALLKDEDLAGVPFLLLANKQDKTDAATPSSLAVEFGLDSVDSEGIIVRGASAKTGGGVEEALIELSEMIRLGNK